MNTNEKKQYIAPSLKCVEFKVERGFNISQGVKSIGSYSNSGDEPQDGGGWTSSDKSRGFLTGNNDDWD